jgi:hypoxanthine phosphoribosyltransferase
MVHDSGYKPTLLVGIMRGGAPMIDLLSRVFKLKCAYLAVESYSGKGVEDEQGDIVFSREMSSIAKIWVEKYYCVTISQIQELL